MKKALESQQKALKQLEKMGIKVDPNKKMSKEEIAAMKAQLLKKGEQMKVELQSQMQTEKKIIHSNINISKLPTKAQVLSIADRFFKRSYKQLNAMVKVRFDADLKEAERNKFSAKEVRILTNKGAGYYLKNQIFFSIYFLILA